MLQAIKQCAPWLNWKVVGVVGLVAVGLILCTGLPSLSILAGIAPHHGAVSAGYTTTKASRVEYRDRQLLQFTDPCAEPHAI